jgi:hypothetical protein
VCMDIPQTHQRSLTDLHISLIKQEKRAENGIMGNEKLCADGGGRLDYIHGSNSGIVSLNPTRGVDVVLPLCVLALLCVGRGLTMGRSPIQGALQNLYIRLRNPENERSWTTVVCRATQKEEEQEYEGYKRKGTLCFMTDTI